MTSATAPVTTGIPTITTVAGTGREGFKGDGGLATHAELKEPAGLAVDSAGNLYIAEPNNFRVRKVSPQGIITTVAGGGDKFGDSGDNGLAIDAAMNEPVGLAVDSTGNLYIADRNAQRVRKVSPQGIITTVAGGGTKEPEDQGQATNALLFGPAGLAVDSTGNLYIADLGNERVRKVSPQGIITIVAGTGRKGDSGDGGQAIRAQLNEPYGLVVDSTGNLYIADHQNDRVRKVNPQGIITTVAGGGDKGPDDQDQATEAQLNKPYGLAMDSTGNLYIADWGFDRVRKVSPQGTITTVAGTGESGPGGDNGPATEAQLWRPYGLAVDSTGNLYIADSRNYRVRKVSGVSAPTDIPKTKSSTEIRARQTLDGRYKISSELSGKVLTVNGGTPNDGTDVIQWQDQDQPHQWWQLNRVDEKDGDVFYTIGHPNSSMVMEAPGEHQGASWEDKKKYAGAGIVMRNYESNGDDQRHRQWKIVPVPGKPDVYKIVNRRSGLVIDVEHGDSEKGRVSQYQLWDHPDGRQQWKLVRVPESKE